ncbi:MAG TPA: hypothetical protein VEC16_02765 [Alphaproteobacteria bacterium]|nr:hypothetical protein [Alphaproteobacteria bacterium]
MKKIKKGQIAGQIFIYMMAVIVIGAIAIIGYGAISKVLTKSCDAEKASFKTNIEEMIEKYTSYGSVNKKTMKAPCEYDTIIFVDTTSVSTPSGRNAFSCASNRIIQDSVKSGADINIFVMSSDRTIPIGHSDLISLAEGSTTKCLVIDSKNGNFYMTLTGLGSSTQISVE